MTFESSRHFLKRGMNDDDYCCCCYYDCLLCYDCGCLYDPSLDYDCDYEECDYLTRRSQRDETDYDLMGLEDSAGVDLRGNVNEDRRD